MSYELKCLKCTSIYQSEDDEPYLCDKCLNNRKKIAEELDKKFSTIQREPVRSELQEIEETCLTLNTRSSDGSIRKITFINVPRNG